MNRMHSASQSPAPLRAGRRVRLHRAWQWPLRAWRYLWAGPNTMVGLLGLLLAVCTGGRVRLIDGVFEVEGGWVASILANIPLLEGGAAALTLGHVVMGQTRAFNELLRAHERVHVEQYEVWGPLFLPAYFASSAWAFATGRDFYRDNYFERVAFERVPGCYFGEATTMVLGPATRPG